MLFPFVRRYCTSHMQHLGLLPVSTKASSKATKNGQHNHHSVEHSTRILSKLGNRSDLLPSPVMTVSAAELSRTAGDPYLFREVDIKCSSTVALDKGLTSTSSSIPIARLYPELAEKLDLESKATISDGHKAVNLVSVSSQSQPVNHISALTVDKQLKDGVQYCSAVSRTAPASLTSVVSGQFPLVITSSSRSSLELQSSNTPTLARLMLDPVINSSAVVSTPLVSYPRQTSLSGGSSASMVHTSPQLLSQALQGLLNVTSAAQAVSLPCSKFPAPRSEVSKPSMRPSQNAPLLHSLCESKLFETGKTTVKPGLPVLRPQTDALSRSPTEDAGRPKSEPCMTCMVRPRPRPNLRHRVDLQLRRKTLNKSAWKLYYDHVARVDCDTDILPCGMSVCSLNLSVNVVTRSSAVTKGPRDTLCYLKVFVMIILNCTVVDSDNIL